MKFGNQTAPARMVRKGFKKATAKKMSPGKGKALSVKK